MDSCPLYGQPTDVCPFALIREIRVIFRNYSTNSSRKDAEITKEIVGNPAGIFFALGVSSPRQFLRADSRPFVVSVRATASVRRNTGEFVANFWVANEQKADLNDQEESIDLRVMKITDALLAEHIVFHNLFDHIEKTAHRLNTIAEVCVLADLLESMLVKHSKSEDELLMNYLDDSIERLGQRETFHEEHEPIWTRAERNWLMPWWVPASILTRKSG
jgi:hypothetical protein